jgi:ATP-grasp domain
VQAAAIAAEADVRHLGTIVGHPTSDRIIAVSTSVVFKDESLPRSFWGLDGAAIDSGFQGHMYTRPRDVQVVSVRGDDDDVPQMVMTAIGVNYELWKSLAGVELLPPTGRLVVASDHPSPSVDALPENLTWHVGSLIDAAVARFRNTGESFLAFVLDNRLAKLLGLRDRGYAALIDQARATSLLMDKNVAMQALEDHAVDCARTYSVDDEGDVGRVMSRIPPTGRYVFKPAGGAAGIGLYGNRGRGAPLELICAHLDELKRAGLLPRRFQIQEFLPGTPYGVTAWFALDGTFQVLELHQQHISETGRFTGGRWTPALQAGHMESARAICSVLATINHPRFTGPIGLDVIDGKVIEVNPRLTASAPIAHVLRREDEIRHRVGSGFRITQVDLNSKVSITYGHIRNGTLSRLIEGIWEDRGALVLPQGLNPFGDSRVVFVNDDSHGTAQRMFAQRISV